MKILDLDTYPKWLNNLLHIMAGITIGWLIFS